MPPLDSPLEPTDPADPAALPPELAETEISEDEIELAYQRALAAFSDHEIPDSFTDDLEGTAADAELDHSLGTALPPDSTTDDDLAARDATEPLVGDELAVLDPSPSADGLTTDGSPIDSDSEEEWAVEPTSTQPDDVDFAGDAIGSSETAGEEPQFEESTARDPAEESAEFPAPVSDDAALAEEQARSDPELPGEDSEEASAGEVDAEATSWEATAGWGHRHEFAHVHPIDDATATATGEEPAGEEPGWESLENRAEIAADVAPGAANGDFADEDRVGDRDEPWVDDHLDDHRDDHLDDRGEGGDDDPVNLVAGVSSDDQAEFADDFADDFADSVADGLSGGFSGDPPESFSDDSAGQVTAEDAVAETMAVGADAAGDALVAEADAVDHSWNKTPADPADLLDLPLPDLSQLEADLVAAGVELPPVDESHGEPHRSDSLAGAGERAPREPAAEPDAAGGLLAACAAGLAAGVTGTEPPAAPETTASTAGSRRSPSRSSASVEPPVAGEPQITWRADAPHGERASAIRGPRGVSAERFVPPPPPSAENITPGQVIEAALFVGGGPLSAGKLYALLRGTIALDDVPELIDELNRLYASQNRPCEIRLGDGGYVLDLRADYEKLRHRVFGQGPREVRLTQDQLEVLALVAYRQPISEAGIAALGRPGSGNILRQLLRRELVSLERGEQGPKDVSYRTTERFLSVFGLASLAELPQPEDLAAR